jgi:hypothetical protein
MAAARRYLLRAQDFQSPDDPALARADRRERSIAAVMAAALIAMGDSLDVYAVQVAVLEHDTDALADLMASPRVVDALTHAYKPVADLFIEAAEAEAGEKFGGLVVYDPLAAVAELAGARQNFMGSLLGQSAQVVQDTLLDSMKYGADPDDVAELLRAVIGLTPRQAQAVRNYRRLLTEGNPEALRRALRDQRFDPTVRSWADGAPVDEAKVDAMVERYAQRSLAYRAKTIARTEGLKAVVNGIRDAYKQPVDSGRLLDSEVRRRWLVVPDERLCPVCGSIPLLNDLEGVGVNEPYKSIEGPIMAPLAHPNCRCTEVYTANLTRLAVQPFAQAA